MTTAVKEHPILFSTKMVQAILEGRKIQTRRIIKPQPEFINNEWCYTRGSRVGPHVTCTIDWQEDKVPPELLSYCPYGQVGDRLWVRETWNLGLSSHGDCPGYKADMKYKCEKSIPADFPLKWKPSLFMPKSAARIWLEITKVRVERLQEITEEDVITEGIKPMTADMVKAGITYYSPLSQFRMLWDSLNEKRRVDITTNLKTVYPYSWNANP